MKDWIPFCQKWFLILDLPCMTNIPNSPAPKPHDLSIASSRRLFRYTNHELHTFEYEPMSEESLVELWVLLFLREEEHYTEL